MDVWLAEAGVRLFEESADACAVLDGSRDDGIRVLAVNAALAQLVGAEVDDLVGAEVDVLYPVAERAEFAATVRRVIDDDEPSSYQVTRELPDERLVLDAKLFPLNDHKVLVCTRDITDERAAIREVRILEAMTETGSWSWNAMDRAVEISGELRRILGFSSDDPVDADRVLERVHPDDRDRVVAAIRRSISQGGSEEVQLRAVRLDGEVRDLCWRGRAVRDPEGTLVRAFGTVQDVTDRRELDRRQQALRQGATEQLRAIKLNDDVVQILARAWLALDLERPEDTREAIEEAITHVREIMSELFETAKRSGGGLRPGDLARASDSGSERATR